MTILQESAFAKLNLTLDVLERRDDGYHNLCSVMQAVSLKDDVRITFNTEDVWRIECQTLGIPTDERNLAWRAADVFFDAVGGRPDGLTIEITKRIPSGAGLGGGSADAAAVLRALNRKREYPLSMDALCAIGAQIGSDVPFCVRNGTALAQGRGERLTQLRNTTEMFFLICKPEVSYSTPSLYQKLDSIAIVRRPNTERMISALRAGALDEIGATFCNVFEQAVIPEHLNDIKSVMTTCGAYGAQMTGSGSAVFGLYQSFEHAAVASKILKEKYPQVFLAKNV